MTDRPTLQPEFFPDLPERERHWLKAERLLIAADVARELGSIRLAEGLLVLSARHGLAAQTLS